MKWLIYTFDEIIRSNTRIHQHLLTSSHFPVVISFPIFNCASNRPFISVSINFFAPVVCVILFLVNAMLLLLTVSAPCSFKSQDYYPWDLHIIIWSLHNTFYKMESPATRAFRFRNHATRKASSPSDHRG